MSLIRQHQLCQHVLVSAHGPRILMLHHTPAIDVEAGDENVLHMLLFVILRILRLDGFPPRFRKGSTTVEGIRIVRS
jgi:hypothetical protein